MLFDVRAGDARTGVAERKTALPIPLRKGDYVIELATGKAKTLELRLVAAGALVLAGIFVAITRRRAGASSPPPDARAGGEPEVSRSAGSSGHESQ